MSAITKYNCTDIYTNIF